jgi:type II secretory pathway pseudopilin PulG
MLEMLVVVSIIIVTTAMALPTVFSTLQYEAAL